MIIVKILTEVINALSPKRVIGPSKNIKIFDQILPYLKSPPYANSVKTNKIFSI